MVELFCMAFSAGTLLRLPDFPNPGRTGFWHPPECKKHRM